MRAPAPLPDPWSHPFTPDFAFATRQMTGNRRNEYRIQYPIADRPTLLVGERAYEVLDLSESGLRVLESDSGPSESDEIDGSVRFGDREQLEVKGRILRRTRKQLAILLDRKRLPYRQIVKEQLYLLGKYPKRTLR